MSEEQVCKEIIEQVGYQEFYRYFQEKTTLIEQQRKEIERLNNIIKEVREYIQDRYNGEVLTHTFDKDNVGELLEILGSEKE